MVAETLEYKGQFDGSQMILSQDKVDAGFIKMDKTAQAAFNGISNGSKSAVQGINSVSSAEKQAAASAHEMGEAHSLGLRTITKAAREGSNSIGLAMNTLKSGSLEAAGAMDILQIALGAAFHGTATLAIVGVAAGIGFVLEKLKAAKEEARDVKWFGDEGEITERYETLMKQYENLKRTGVWDGFSLSVSKSTAALEKNLATAKKLKENLEAQQGLESRIAQIEADKVRAHGEEAVALAAAGADPIGRMKVQQAAVLAEKTRELDQIGLLVKEHQLQQEVVRMQLAVKAATKEEIAEEGKNKARLRKLDLQLTAENAMYKAKGDELISIRKAQGLELGNEGRKPGKNAPNLFGEQSDQQWSSSYEAQMKKTETDQKAHLKLLGEQMKASEDSEYEQLRMGYAAKKALDQDYLNSKRDAMSAAAGLAGQFSGAYKAAFLAEKAFAIASVVVASEAAAAKIQANMAVMLSNPITAPFAAEGAGALAWLRVTEALQIATIAASAIQGFAKGTSRAPRGLAWVGEQGPELVDFRGGERVIPHQQSMSMVQGSNYYGGSHSITINATPNQSPDDIATAVVNHPDFRDQFRNRLIERQGKYQRTQA